MISIEYKLPINCCAQLRLDGISQWSAVARLYCCCVSWFSKSRPLGFWLNFPCWCCWVQFCVDYLLIKFLAFFSWAFSELLQILEDRSTTQWFHNHALCLWLSCLFLLQKFPKLLLLSFFGGVEVSLSGLDLDPWANNWWWRDKARMELFKGTSSPTALSKRQSTVIVINMWTC